MNERDKAKRCSRVLLPLVTVAVFLFSQATGATFRYCLEHNTTADVYIIPAIAGLATAVCWRMHYLMVRRRAPTTAKGFAVGIAVLACIGLLVAILDAGSFMGFWPCDNPFVTWGMVYMHVATSMAWFLWAYSMLVAARASATPSREV